MLAQQQPEPLREPQPGQLPEPQPRERWVQQLEPLNSLAPQQVQPRELQPSLARLLVLPQGPVRASNSCIRPTLSSP